MREGSLSPWDISLSVCSFGWSRFCSGMAATDIKHFQEETLRMRRATEEYESTIAEAQVSLQKLTGNNARLVSSDPTYPTLTVASLIYDQSNPARLHQWS